MVPFEVFTFYKNSKRKMVLLRISKSKKTKELLLTNSCLTHWFDSCFSFYSKVFIAHKYLFFIMFKQGVIIVELLGLKSIKNSFEEIVCFY